MIKIFIVFFKHFGLLLAAIRKIGVHWDSIIVPNWYFFSPWKVSCCWWRGVSKLSKYFSIADCWLMVDFCSWFWPVQNWPFIGKIKWQQNKHHFSHFNRTWLNRKQKLQITYICFNTNYEVKMECSTSIK